MTSAAERLAATATALAPAPRTEPDAPRPSDDPVVPVGTFVRTDPVRVTVDLLPAHHRALKLWEEETRWTSASRRPITHQAVITTLLEMMRTDEALARKVAKRLTGGAS